MAAVTLSHGDRALYRGLGAERGKQCDIIAARPATASIRLDNGTALLVTTKSLTWIPRRPPPQF